MGFNALERVWEDETLLHTWPFPALRSSAHLLSNTLHYHAIPYKRSEAFVIVAWVR
jgi:hypothetical protein